MKSAILLFPVLLVACAPKAIVLIEAGANAPSRGGNAVAARSGDDDGSGPDPGPMPAGDGNGLGLLDPSGLTKMPDEREMRPTVDTGEDRAVIANPPEASDE